jgi:hypothetical protein
MFVDTFREYFREISINDYQPSHAETAEGTTCEAGALIVPKMLNRSNNSINSLLYSCFASAFALSKPSILCSAFLVFPTISGNLLPARSKRRRLTYIGFWDGNGRTSKALYT